MGVLQLLAKVFLISFSFHLHIYMEHDRKSCFKFVQHVWLNQKDAIMKYLVSSRLRMDHLASMCFVARDDLMLSNCLCTYYDLIYLSLSLS